MRYENIHRKIHKRSQIIFAVFLISRFDFIGSEKSLKDKNQKLIKAIEEIKTLRGIIPICSNCKQIRDDKGAWKQVEEYIEVHSEAEFSHSLCPHCMCKLYPEYGEPDATDVDKH